MVDLNLDASSPDTFQRPPTPIPFDVVLGYPQSTGGIITGSSLQKGSYMHSKELDCKVQAGGLASPRKFGVELSKLLDADTSKTEEEVCPTCFEGLSSSNLFVTNSFICNVLVSGACFKI